MFHDVLGLMGKTTIIVQGCKKERELGVFMILF